MDNSSWRIVNLFNELRACKEDIPFSISLLENKSSIVLDFLNTKSDHRKNFSYFLESNELFGVFDCSYHPYLKVEYTSFEPVSVNIEIPSTFKNIRCVSQNASSEGIGNEQVVAIFPENFLGVKVDLNDPVFYFVNKFVDRYLKYTYPYIKKNRLENLLGGLNTLNVDDLKSIVANWVNLHEISHRKGLMPLPEFLFEKSGRFTAGLEELRADILAMKFCIEKSKGSNSFEELTAHYILRERLISYPLFRSRENFDTISAVLFHKFLNEMEFFKNPSLDLSKLLKILSKLEDLISSFEMEALKKGKTPTHRRDILTSCIQGYLVDYDKQFEYYINFWSN